MLFRLALILGLSASFTFAADVPSDHRVNGFTAQTRPFSTQDLMKSLISAFASTAPEPCAIPLREFKGGNGLAMDPAGRPAGDPKIDPIAKPAPVRPCRFIR